MFRQPFQPSGEGSPSGRGTNCTAIAAMNASRDSQKPIFRLTSMPASSSSPIPTPISDASDRSVRNRNPRMHTMPAPAMPALM